MARHLRQFEEAELRGDKDPYRGAFALLRALCNRREVTLSRMTLLKYRSGYCGFKCTVGEGGDKLELIWHRMEGEEWSLQFGKLSTAVQFKTIVLLGF
ncbi:hypothetical protein COV06_02350 [Candidatus Uhrbacteria bacterium CG10_big_fil_rev_8_21_14_0_10_50_16]|uniref:Uncharacterized protein n=1 Tax=Candidatus Uhrbacteria bacterium CG10_big_fil_rev_8_21_14_0_10_50_16 TaxID=1975039 RepID=A0A2H0RM57_9BACT|nr:MAG: hypothetical protein COV06_02350 [Candidatus Uhrbacteria bacterium CG10_big_fil_rev_8_21_14_0_10_50_16]